MSISLEAAMGQQLRSAVVALLLLGGLGGPTAAQTADTTHPGTESNPAAVPSISLNAAQKQTIYSSISSQKQRETEPPTFRAAVGAVVPNSIELQPLPKTL